EDESHRMPRHGHQGAEPRGGPAESKFGRDQPDEDLWGEDVEDDDPNGCCEQRDELSRDGRALIPGPGLRCNDNCSSRAGDRRRWLATAAGLVCGELGTLHRNRVSRRSARAPVISAVPFVWVALTLISSAADGRRFLVKRSRLPSACLKCHINGVLGHL